MQGNHMIKDLNWNKKKLILKIIKISKKSIFAELMNKRFQQCH